MHLERDYEELNAEVLRQRKTIAQQEQRIAGLENLVQRLLEQIEHGPTSS